MTLREQAELKDDILQLLTTNSNIIIFVIAKELDKPFDDCFVICEELISDDLIDWNYESFRNRDDKMIWILPKGRILLSEPTRRYLFKYDAENESQEDPEPLRKELTTKETTRQAKQPTLTPIKNIEVKDWIYIIIAIATLIVAIFAL